MSELLSIRFDEPNEIVTLPKLSGQIVVLGEAYVGRYVHEPGFRWSTDVRPFVGTASCLFHHQGVVLSGRLHVVTNDGAQKIIGPGEAFNIPPGHDARVVGDEPCVTIEFRGARDWARPATGGERVLATLLVTDIVGSTATAARLGDAEWKNVLAKHFERVRVELDRYRGYEVATTGDGLLAVFDGAARAVRCAAAITGIAHEDGIAVRAGVHSGEVERTTDNVRGVAVHMASRVAALAGPGEVLVSAPTVALLDGSGLAFADAGEHELKGLGGRRRVYRLTSDAGKADAQDALHGDGALQEQ